MTNAAEYVEFCNAMTSAQLCYRGQVLEEETLNAYWQALRVRAQLPLRAIVKAIDAACRESREWFPTAYQIETHAKAIAKTLDTPRGDLSRPALPEPTQRLSGTEFDKRVEEIGNAARTGLITPAQFWELMQGAIEKAPKRECKIGEYGRRH